MLIILICISLYNFIHNFLYKLKRLILFLSLLTYFTSYTQNSFTLSGYVTEEETGESLIGVSVFDEKSLIGTTTNQYGFYSLTLESGTYSIQYSFIGLKTFTKTINLFEDKRVNISLKNNSIKTCVIIPRI